MKERCLAPFVLLLLLAFVSACERDYVTTSQPGGGPSQQPAETVPMPDPDDDATPRPTVEKSGE